MWSCGADLLASQPLVAGQDPRSATSSPARRDERGTLLLLAKSDLTRQDTSLTSHCLLLPPAPDISHFIPRVCTVVHEHC